MKFEVLVHGVPYGQDYWGPDFDRSYAAPFYNTSENGLQYVVETRKADGKNYCYYTYARYGNVLDCEGRRGSYVAVTYRFDMFYTDAKRVFQILETVFEKCILGSIIEYSGTNYKFLCRSLKEKEDVMKKVEDDTLKLLQLSVLNNKLLTIDDAFIHKNVAKTILNIDDCTDSNVLSALKQVSKVVATLDAPDARDKKIAELQGSLATEKAQHQKDNEVWRGKLEAIKTDDKLIAENQNLSNELFQSKKNYESLETKFKKLSKKLSATLCILVPLLILSLGGLAYLRFIAPQQLGQVPKGYVSQSEYDKLKDENRELTKALVDSDTSGQIERLNNSIENLKKKNEELFNQNVDYANKLDSLRDIIKILPSEGPDQSLGGGIENGATVSNNDLMISFIGKTKPFTMGQKYLVGVVYKKNNKLKLKEGTLYNGTGIWHVEGFDMEPSDEPTSVYLKPRELTSGEKEHKITVTFTNVGTVVRDINNGGGLSFRK